MANQAGLVRQVASSLHINEATLSVQMRVLREADLIPTGGRGKGSYAVTPENAATLMTAAAVSSSVKDTAIITKSFLDLPLDFHEVRGPGQHLDHGSHRPGPSLRDPWPGLSLQRVLRKFGFARIGDPIDFGSALTAIVEMFIKSEVFPALEQSDFEADADIPGSLSYERSVTVQFYLPIPCAQIGYRASRILTEYLTFGPAKARRLGLSTSMYKFLLEQRGMSGSLIQVRSLDEVALEKIAKAVGKEGLREAMAPRPSKRKKEEAGLPVDDGQEP
jgi:hypothetical protein